MMNCCQCQGIEQVFDDKRAREELEEYRKKGVKRTTRMLLGAVETAVSHPNSLLDIGGGVGGIQHALADKTERIVNVDASSAYLALAQEEARRLGYADKVAYRHGNFVDIAPELEPVDVVTLDRVICCYHDMEGLVSASVAKAKRLYAVVYPRDVWWLRLLRPLATFGLWAARNPFRIFVHSQTAVDALIRQQGFQQRYRETAGMWQVVVYQK
ncbi:MAG: class I SAM-dependent methyltransferase [Ardenticatenaceae bacterium]|nr:class I SAM-dependent methyltransferase [Ardenticatenaceae bacterium]